MLYHLEKDEKPISVWGCKVLDQKMNFIKPGDKIKITYLGLGNKSHGKNAPKLFSVAVDRDFGVREPEEVSKDNPGVEESGEM